MDIYYFGIIARSKTGKGNQLKDQLSGNFCPIVGLDGSWLVLDGLGW
jgi:hypothetical protein